MGLCVVFVKTLTICTHIRLSNIYVPDTFHLFITSSYVCTLVQHIVYSCMVQIKSWVSYLFNTLKIFPCLKSRLTRLISGGSNASSDHITASFAKKYAAFVASATDPCNSVWLLCLLQVYCWAQNGLLPVKYRYGSIPFALLLHLLFYLFFKIYLKLLGTVFYLNKINVLILWYI